MITVYTNPSCVQCDQTKKYLDKNSLSYEVVDLSTNPDALTMVTELGFKSAPVVITDTDKWSGFRPDIIAKLAKVAA